MAEIRMLPTVGEIEEVARRIGEHFHPSKVILFGSYVYGKPIPDSDVDLLVVMETPLRSVEQAVAIRRVVDFPFPTDLLVRTPRQVAERSALGDLLIREALTKGRVLYEAADSIVD